MKAILNNILSFNKLISEEIIKLLYYVGLLGIALAFVFNIWESFTSGVVAFLPLLVAAIIVALVSILAWRVVCELIVVLFRMHKRLGAINTALGGANDDDDTIPGDEALKAAREAAMKAKDRVSASVKDVAEDTKEAASKAGSAVKDRTSKAASAAKSKAAELKPGEGEIEVIPPKKPASKPRARSTTTKKPATRKTSTTAKKTTPRKKPTPKS